MSSYCECGHVLAEHHDFEPDEEMAEAGALPDYGCYGDGGTCQCSGFEKIPESILDRGWD
jgi:hypothetical protein